MRTAGYLIESEDLDGPTNMALDEVLWTESAHGTAFCRLYGWADRPVLSLGYFQHADEVRSDPRLRELPFVRRLTGGGAIVHDREITYSLALPARRAPATNALYDRVHRAIATSLVELGIPASVDADTQRGDRSDRLCFCRSDRFAVRVCGVKVLGSSQRRRQASVLMHGSLLLGSSPAAPHVRGLSDVLESVVSVESLRQALHRAVAAALDLDLQPIELARDLRLRAIALADSKYRTAAWNDRARPAQTKHLREPTQPDVASRVCELDR